MILLYYTVVVVRTLVKYNVGWYHASMWSGHRVGWVCTSTVSEVGQRALVASGAVETYIRTLYNESNPFIYYPANVFITALVVRNTRVMTNKSKQRSPPSHRQKSKSRDLIFEPFFFFFSKTVEASWSTPFLLPLQ